MLTIAPSPDRSFDVHPFPSFSFVCVSPHRHVLYDLMNFLTRPVRDGPRTVVQCYIVRKRSGTLRLHPQPVSPPKILRSMNCFAVSFVCACFACVCSHVCACACVCVVVGCEPSLLHDSVRIVCTFKDESTASCAGVD